MNKDDKKCIYCSNRDPSSFGQKCHVLSQFMGNFQPDIYFQGDIVCDECNNELGKTIETDFAKKSFEGLIARLHLRRKKKGQSPIILYDSSLLKFNFQTEKSIAYTYDSMLLLVKSILDKIGSTKDTLLLLRKGSLYAFIFAEDVARVKSQNKIKKLRYKIRDFRKGTEFGEWIGDRDDSAEIVKSALSKLKLKANFDDESINEQPDQIKSNFTALQNVDANTARFIAKVVFEYFVYCANESNLIFKIFSEEMEPIREFIKEGKGDAKDFVGVVSNDFVSSRIKQNNNHYFLAFELVGGSLVGRVAFMDTIGYKVNIGKSPFSLVSDKIGNAHAFNLNDKTSKRMYSTKVPIVSGNIFSIYNKF